MVAGSKVIGCITDTKTVSTQLKKGKIKHCPTATETVPFPQFHQGKEFERAMGESRHEDQLTQCKKTKLNSSKKRTD